MNIIIIYNNIVFIVVFLIVTIAIILIPLELTEELRKRKKMFTSWFLGGRRDGDRRLLKSWRNL